MERCINVGMILDIKDQECKDCSFFPVCYGGCAAYKNKICSSVKWNAEEMLELMKEMAQ